jgi:hypothetical protein
MNAEMTAACCMIGGTWRMSCDADVLVPRRRCTRDGMLTAASRTCVASVDGDR